MFRTVISLYLFATVLGTAYLAAFANSKGRTAIARFFSLMSLGVSVYLFGYLLELNASGLDEMIYWNQIQYLFLPFYSTLWLFVSLLYTRTIKSPRPAMLLAGFIIPAVTFLMRLTNANHSLFYVSMTLERTDFFPVLALGKGPWYLVHSAYNAICFLIGIIAYIAGYKRLSAARRTGFFLMLCAAFLAVCGNVLILADPGSFRLDYSALLLPFSLVFQMLALFRYDFLSLRTLARELVFEYTSDGMLVVDETLGFTDCNAAAARIIPELATARTGTALSTLFRKYPELTRTLTGENRRMMATNLDTANDRSYTVKMVDIRNHAGLPAGKLIQLVDNTEERQMRERLSRQATTDHLTRLANRGSFLEQAGAEFQIARQKGHAFSLLMIDIDHFKLINDSHGHAAGDSALHDMAELLRAHFRKTDLLGRIGGEEFSILLPDTDLDNATAAAETFRKVIETNSCIYEGKRIRFTISIGVATWHSGYENFDELMKEADRCLYASKSNGRNRVTAAALPSGYHDGQGLFY